MNAVATMTREQREQLLKAAHYNVFKIKSRHILLDLLTDSGTGQMSNNQWECMQISDEAYAGSSSAGKLMELIRRRFNMYFVHLVPQGRCAENVLFEFLLDESGMVIVGNTPFDTTRIHIESRGGIIDDCSMHKHIKSLGKHFIEHKGFLGDVDIQQLNQKITDYRHLGRQIACMLITATCNSRGGQPVSLDNIHRACVIARQANIPIFLDLARYAENAYFIQEYEMRRKKLTISVQRIVYEMARYADGILVSAKKDMLGNIGGFLALKNYHEELSLKVREKITRDYGLDSELGGYGGLAGYSMEAMWQGLNESCDEGYLKRRVGQVATLARKLHAIGVPVLPPGGHAVFIDATKFLPHLKWHDFPGHALSLALYREGGIRSVEVGSLMLGADPQTGKNRRASQELLRLAIPRRTYTDEELELVVETFKRLVNARDTILGVRIVKDNMLRHFAGEFVPIEV